MSNRETRPPRGPKNMRVPEKAKDFKGAIIRLFSELKNHRIAIIIAITLAIISAILTIFAPNKLKDLTNEISKGLIMQTMNMDEVKRITLFIAGFYLCSAMFNYIQTICMTVVSNKFAKELRGRISKKINKLPLKFFDNHQIGDILSRVTNDVDTIAQSMHNSLASLVSNITLFFGTIIMMFVTNWIMALTAILASVIRIYWNVCNT